MEDAEWLVTRKWAFVCSEMRTGKSKTVIDAAQALYESGEVERVLVVCPAPVKDVWYDPVLGELAKHLWDGISTSIIEYHERTRLWNRGPEKPTPDRLQWIITNYEFLRSRSRLEQLMPFCGHRTLLVLDESSFVKNWKAQQTKACVTLRRNCGRVWLLNGTPLYHSPLDLFSQGNLLHPSVLDCKFITYFKARYTVQAPVLSLGGKALKDDRGNIVQKIERWVNLDDLQRRFASCTVRRLQRDCLDLPPKLDPVALTATLTPETWRAYRDMRDQLLVWLKDGTIATGATAAVRVMRLAQITSGFVGGIEDYLPGTVPEGLLDSLDLSDIVGAPSIEKKVKEQATRLDEAVVHEIGHEKLDVLLWFLRKRWEEDPNVKVVAWSRFRAEVSRATAAVREAFPRVEVAEVWGTQQKADRLYALSLLKPETAPPGPAFVAGIEGTGSFGLDMTASHLCITLSSGYSPGKSAQTLDRVYGPGQRDPVAYYDVVAVGPKGQHTIDHAVLAARRAGEDIATWTATAWVKALSSE